MSKDKPTGAKDVFLIMREEDYNQIPTEDRLRLFKGEEFRYSNEYEVHKSDPIYIKLYKKHKAAKRELREYIFKKNHKIR